MNRVGFLVVRLGLVRLSVFLLALGASSLAHAQVGPDPDRPEIERPAAPPRTAAEVVALLSGFEEAPRRDEWRAFGTAMIPLLRAVAEDTGAPGYARLRAVRALGAFENREARVALRRALRRPEALMVREAALAMTEAFGAAAEADVAPLLSHADTAVREAAIDALGRMGTAGARARLQARLPQERDEVLRARIEERLRGGVGSSPG